MNLVGALFCGRCSSPEVTVSFDHAHHPVVWTRDQLDNPLPPDMMSVRVKCERCYVTSVWVINQKKLKLSVEVLP